MKVDTVVFHRADRETLREASEALKTLETLKTLALLAPGHVLRYAYLAGRLEGLAGRVAVGIYEEEEL